MMNNMNIEKWNLFQRTVLKLVKSGDLELNPPDIKEIKTLCKKGDVVMGDVFGLLIKHLHTNHCQVRISAFQILDELFRRSHEVRELTLERLKTIVSLTLALELTEELPPPRKFHSHLKKYVIKAIDEWNEKFGLHYNKLKVSYKFLQSKKNVDFKKLIARTLFEQDQEERRLKEEQNVAEYNVLKIISIFEVQSASFKDCVFEASACFNMLSPEGSIFLDKNRDLNCTDNVSADNQVDTNGTLSLTIDRSKNLKIQETTDNSSIIQTLDDRIHQAKRSFIPKLDAWIEKLIKNNAKQNDVLPLIKSKEQLSRITCKYDELDIIRTSKRKRRIVQKELDENSDSDFDEVDEEEVLNQMPEEKRLKLAIEMSGKGYNTDAFKDSVITSKRFVEDDEAPSSSCKTNVNSIHARTVNDNQMVKVLKDQATIDEEDLALHKMSLVRFESLHRFWGTKDVDAEDLDINTVRALNPKYCNVPGKFEPVEWSCRTPMKSGKLCPRMDRFKCPLHGKVVPRDMNGVPKRESLFKNSEILSAAQASGSSEMWKEVEAEIERQTGEKLNYSKIKKKREKKPTNLVNISNKVLNTPRSRIENKILSRNARKHANASADKQDANRNNSAFDQQFNYV